MSVPDIRLKFDVAHFSVISFFNIYVPFKRKFYCTRTNENTTRMNSIAITVSRMFNGRKKKQFNKY